ncbi:NAD(P)H-quinone oxidoreductase subunit N [Leptothoe kymatousa]|uniref:NAD(P)H-quinone oxidoreductase subunit N n=1 Tax=Leptothoe kymatousa TAU-MAC 1615 TaxID=2364775 RepID=A0ABS5Y3C1_9CYAN|nr:NAD(P)H-quinone oxidoreductase subunit N [Leptothoe kymatousa]MBT9312320.1 NAD(P)H-quinone oxidoreductase subunit N [Leptothoe kymatousa TAU-MAC 1615]
MGLLVLGNRFVRDLESNGALAVRVPLEGGFEGRYQRRMRATGYESLHLSARGLGDLSAYLRDVHGVRPPHLGKKSNGQAAVGDRYFVPPVLDYRLERMAPGMKGIVLWLIEGHILSSQELAYLVALCEADTRIKVVVELGGERVFKWFPLKDSVQSA